MSLAIVPLDVILELTFFLDLQDSLRLLATCSAFVSLSSTKDFWFKTLDRIQNAHMQPLPCPYGVDISGLPIEALRKLAIHAYTLRRNWTSDRLVPVSVRKFPLGEDCLEICPIHGTNLVVTNSLDRLMCWSTTSGALLGAVEHVGFEAVYALGRSPPFQLLGQCFIGVSYMNSTSVVLNVVEIDYRNENKITVSRTYSKTLSRTDARPGDTPDVALDDKVIATVFTSSVDELSTLVYCHFNDNIVHHVPLGIRAGSHPTCMRHEGHFYISGQNNDQPCTMVRVSVTRSDSGIHHEVETIPITLPSHFPDALKRVISSAPALLRPPNYGVLNVTGRTSEIIAGDLHKHSSCVYFWPTADTGLRLEMGEAISYEHETNISGLVVGLSGTYALLMDQERRINMVPPKARLGLVHYATHRTPHPTFHRLDTSSIEVNFYTAVIALDDALGVVYVTHIGQREAASMSVLTYA
ncbi:hypothetical protein B0H11DRAFT_2110391 [Mycena galericulata]|nr:hypothetical protein B0H11DRAFT_2110391 [Mycena galericulata]